MHGRSTSCDCVLHKLKLCIMHVRTFVHICITNETKKNCRNNNHKTTAINLSFVDARVTCIRHKNCTGIIIIKTIDLSFVSYI